MVFKLEFQGTLILGAISGCSVKKRFGQISLGDFELKAKQIILFHNMVEPLICYCGLLIY